MPDRALFSISYSLEYLEGNCLKRVGCVLDRYSSTHEKTVLNRSLRCRMVMP